MTNKSNSAPVVDSSHIATLLSLSEIARGLIHEVNNKLTIILAGTKVLQVNAERNTLNRSIVDEWTGSIEASCQQLIGLVSALVSVGRSTDGEVPERLGIEEITGALVKISQGSFKKHGIKLDIEIDNFLLTNPIKLARGQVSQLLLALLIHCKLQIADLPKKWVRLQVSKRDASLEFLVSDSSGKAILPPKEQEQQARYQFIYHALAVAACLNGSIDCIKKSKYRVLVPL